MDNKVKKIELFLKSPLTLKILIWFYNYRLMFNHSTALRFYSDDLPDRCKFHYTTISGINVREGQIDLESDGVTVPLKWDELNPLYSVDVTVIPEVQVNTSNSSARLIVAYNMMYNVTIGVSQPCQQNNEIIFAKVYYYPCTSAREYITLHVVV